jgi:hypothetical protein
MLQTLASLVQDLDPDSSVGGFTLFQPAVVVLTGAVLPLLTSFLVRPSMPQWVKVVLGGLAAIVTTLVVENVQADGSAFVSYEFLLQAFGTWAVSVLTYIGAWKQVTNGQLNAMTGPGLPIEARSSSHSSA